jgi:hypothetical protein
VNVAQDQTLAVAYLSPSTDSMWRWAPGGDVLTWHDGSTIAFRGEVEAVLARLAPQGLPPFGAVVMLLASCRDGWVESAARKGYAKAVGAVVEEESRERTRLRNPPHGLDRYVQRVVEEVGKIVTGLDAVNRLPASVRHGKEAKAVLAETVFEGSTEKRLSPSEAAVAVKALADGVNAERLTLPSSKADSRRQFAQEVEALRPGLGRVDAEALALRLKTGLDQLPREADADLAPSERVRRLLAELRGDRELAGLARLAQDLMAAVHVPRTLHEHEELPLGGVSDLTNRGPLDRLLLSELAYDELTLAVRVALNEALYLRRESPPRQPPNRRAILIDTGIRMWGVPRVFGVAVALALAATTDKDAELETFRATATDFEPVDLTTRAGLVECLEALETRPHPGAAVKAFCSTGAPPVSPCAQEHGRGARATGSAADHIVITHPDAIADPGFTAAVSALDNPAFYVATVDRTGDFSLLTLTAAGRKPVREAKLSLESILAESKATTPGARPPQPGTPLIVRSLSPELPVILSVEPFPLRVPYVADPKHARASRKHGLVAVSKDARLLHWDSPYRAARQVTALLPPGKPRGIWVDEATGVVRLLFGYPNEQSARLVTADLSPGAAPPSVTFLRLRESKPFAACAHAGVLYCVFARTAESFDLATGQPLAPLLLPQDVNWERDRFFQGNSGWLSLAHDGQRATLLPVPLPDGVKDKVLTLFDRQGYDGPWAVLDDGRVLDGEGKDFPRRFLRLPVRWQLGGVSPDGHRIVLRAFDKKLLDLESQDAEPRTVTADPAEELLVPMIYWSTRFSSVARHRFDKVFLDENGRLSLVNHKENVFQVATNERGEPILKELGRFPSRFRAQPFVPVDAPPGMRFDLRAATWRDGSRAYLDSRGMLHLKSADGAVPEASLVLSNDKLAGWTSDGKLYGPTQFRGDTTAADPADLMAVIGRFVGRLR